MKKSIDAMKSLDYSDRQIAEIFDRRNLKREYRALTQNRFRPFDIPEGLEDAFIRNARENGYDNPFNTQTAITIGNILRRLRNLTLDGEYPTFDFEEPIEIENLSSLPAEVGSATPIVQPIQNAQVLPQTNLTPIETALLSPEEQIIRQRNRT